MSHGIFYWTGMCLNSVRESWFGVRAFGFNLFTQIGYIQLGDVFNQIFPHGVIAKIAQSHFTNGFVFAPALVHDAIDRGNQPRSICTMLAMQQHRLHRWGVDDA